MTKESKPKWYWDRVRQYKQNRNFQITKENSSNKLVEMAQRKINNRMQNNQNNIGVKYGNGKNITEIIGFLWTGHTSVNKAVTWSIGSCGCYVIIYAKAFLSVGVSEGLSQNLQSSERPAGGSGLRLSIPSREVDKRIRRTRCRGKHTAGLAKSKFQENTKLENTKKYLIGGFRWKISTSIHGKLPRQLSKCLQAASIREWMTKGKDILIQKDPKEN